MTDGLLADNDIEETRSRVYVQAVAARAGYSTADYSFVIGYEIAGAWDWVR